MSGADADKAKKDKWHRADKISLVSLIVAIAALSGSPYVSKVYQHFSGPDATITEPQNGSVQSSYLFGASGTARNIPAGDDLWLVVRAAGNGEWYPVTRLIPQNGLWIVGANVIRPANGSQTLEVIMLPDSNEATFNDYVNALDGPKHSNPGVSSLPAGYTIEAVAHLLIH
jgi:hypothetical protein